MLTFPFSDGAKLIMEYGRQRLLRPDWKSVFEPDDVKQQVQDNRHRDIAAADAVAMRLGIGSYTFAWAIGVPGIAPASQWTPLACWTKPGGLG